MSRYKLTDKGWAAYCRMENMYYTELDLIRHETNDPNYECGVSIIMEQDRIVTIDDEVDYLILCYEEKVLDILADWVRYCLDEDGLDAVEFPQRDGGWTIRDLFKRIAERGLLEVV